jgi:hypothetical protein
LAAFDYCWRIRSNEKRKPNTLGSDFFDNYRAERSKIHISQLVKRVEGAFKAIKI